MCVINTNERVIAEYCRFREIA